MTIAPEVEAIHAAVPERGRDKAADYCADDADGDGDENAPWILTRHDPFGNQASEQA